MTTPTSGNDVFEMAMGMEQIGKDFYTALAVASDNAEVRTFCLKVAREEESHLAAFRGMRDQWAKSVKANRVTPEAAYEFAALAKGRIQPDPAATRKVAMGGHLKAAVDMAIQMEKDSISFYQEMLARLPGSAKAIQGIVEEEKRHLSRLQLFGY